MDNLKVNNCLKKKKIGKGNEKLREKRKERRHKSSEEARGILSLVVIVGLLWLLSQQERGLRARRLG